MTLMTQTHGFLFSKQVCYGKYGCFRRQPGLDAITVKLPESPSTVGTTFQMFTRSGSGFVNDVDVAKLKAAKFVISRRTIFIIHGYQGEDRVRTYPTRMKNALLEREDCNVIVVNWNPGARGFYPQAAGNTRLVGAQTAVLIRFLITSSSGSPSFADRFYIVGYSLGAHVAGYAGTYLKDRGMTLGRITALDPAGLFFKRNDVRFRLDPGDAAYVDVIHTSLLGIGTSQTNGHTEFFPNGGKKTKRLQLTRLIL